MSRQGSWQEPAGPFMSDHIQRSKKRLNRILAENTGRTEAEIEAATDRDHYLTAVEAAVKLPMYKEN